MQPPPRLRGSAVAGLADEVTRAVEENLMIVIGRRGCCMCHVAYRLLLGLGVNSAMHEIVEAEEGDVVDRLREMTASDDNGEGAGVRPWRSSSRQCSWGGGCSGGLEKVMTCHISGEQEPVLREAGALWL
ncbi:hypothetical protein MLD38_039903 [Melastoma candidum]|uniref:Uncharacterized protein n=1 Tax=Melastoma candidum TaxID=119954 RepID=A0ACB9L4A6_9MYRT|nr:hypothetical protein MLD38_039903 [Melastoma candidum]